MACTVTRSPAPNFVIDLGVLLLQSWLPSEKLARDAGRSALMKQEWIKCLNLSG